MRRVHLRGHDNIAKRYLVHVAAFNLRLLMRKLLGVGTPRQLANRLGRGLVAVSRGLRDLVARFLGMLERAPSNSNDFLIAEAH